MDNFENRKVKNYRHWTIYLYQYQNYLGRCIIWCKRKDALDLAEMKEGEKKELFFIIRQLKAALKNTFHADWFNYSFLGNEARHLHCHFIPRYSSNREFGGIIFKDEYWDHNYKTDKSFVIPEELFEGIRQKIENTLSNKGGFG